MSKTIFFLVKIFDKKEYALDFMQGKMFANRLSYFRRLDEKQEANRGDKHEAVVSWVQPEDANLTINGIHITQLAGPISIQMNRHDHLNIYCMYAGHSGEFESLTEENLRDFKKHLEISEDCVKLGKYAVVVTQYMTFIDRVSNAVRSNNYGLRAGLVDYYDPNTFTGSFNEVDAVFKKRNEFSHQKEFRFAFDTGVSGDNSLILDIGDITDITTLCNVEELNELLTISLKSTSTTGEKIA